MAVFELQFDVSATVARRAHVGVVGSGDLEVLVEPGPAGRAAVRVRTSVDGFEEIWEHTLRAFFERHGVGGRFELNDLGATPGVVSLRLMQAIAEAGR